MAEKRTDLIPRPYLQSIDSSSNPSLSLSLYLELTKSKQTFLLTYTGIMAYLISSWTITGIVVSRLLFLLVGLFLAISGSTLLNVLIKLFNVYILASRKPL